MRVGLRPRFEIFDSAGVHVVENALPPAGARLGWRIGPGPSLSIGSVDGDEPYLFNGAVSAAKLPDGRIVVADGSSRSDSAVLEVRDGDGGVLASLDRQLDGEQRRWKDDRGANWSEGTPYGRSLAKGLWGDLVVASHTSRYEIRAFREDGALARIVRREHTPRATTPADFDRYRERELAEYSTLLSRAVPGRSTAELDYILSLRRKTIEATPMADTFPAFSSFIADAAGHLWVREYDFPGEERPAPLWTVFDPDGRVFGYLETPPGLRIFEIARTRSWGGSGMNWGWRRCRSGRWSADGFGQRPPGVAAPVAIERSAWLHG